MPWCRMRVVTICLPESYVEGVDELIGQNKYPNRSEVIRIAIRDLLVDELWGDRKPSNSLPLVAQLQKLAQAQEPPPEPPS
jgi:antitoxin ParD1/3/4